MKKLLEAILFLILTSFIKLIGLTYRIKIVDNSGLDIYGKAPLDGVVMAVWHNRLLFSPVLVKKRIRRNFVSIASNSDDGRYAATYMKSFSVSTVRGSSSRGGATAMKQLVKKMTEEEKSVVITIDGPRGPKYSCKAGAPKLASMTGRKLVPYVINSASYWQLRSWDHTQIPKPFTKIELVFAPAVAISKDLSKEQLIIAQATVVEAMLAITIDKKDV